MIKEKIGNDYRKSMTCKQCEKLKSRLKMMEISFEQINNSRNDLIRQLTECEEALEKNERKS